MSPEGNIIWKIKWVKKREKFIYRKSKSDFDFFVGYVFQYGERGHFFRKIFYYLFIDGYKYWIDAEDDGTFIINRAKINGNDYVNKRDEI